jgi:hypothetical protein
VSAYLLGLATLPALAAVVVLVVLSPAAWEWIKPGNTTSGCYLCGKVWRLRKAHTSWHRWVGCPVARGRRARRRVTNGWDADERLRRVRETRAAMSAAKGRWKA